MSWFYYFFVFDDVDKFFVLEVDDDFVAIFELIEESKYIIIISFCPGIVGTMAKYETISFFSWIS